MTRVRLDLFLSLDGCAATAEPRSAKEPVTVNDLT
jgi:hypothetical protein